MIKSCPCADFTNNILAPALKIASLRPKGTPASSLPGFLSEKKTMDRRGYGLCAVLIGALRVPIAPGTPHGTTRIGREAGGELPGVQGECRAGAYDIGKRSPIVSKRILTVRIDVCNTFRGQLRKNSDLPPQIGQFKCF